MRILILGGKGMIGHAAWQVLSTGFDSYVSIRSPFNEVRKFNIFDKKKTICNVDANDFSSVKKAVEKVSPDVVLNCIGIIKQIKEAKNPIRSIEVNSLFPHKLAALCDNKCRLIHMSTDCVFSGKKGSYIESDDADPQDLYGRTKLLGELTKGNVLTLRTSVIGRELDTKYELLEWFLNQEGKIVLGYKNAVFSGVTTSALCIMLKHIILNHPELKGLYHVSSVPISKFDLLMLIKKKLNFNVKIIPDDKFNCNRSLDSSKFRMEVNYDLPSWENMIAILAEEVKKGA